MNIRGGFWSPTAISIAREQWASICAGYIVPHARAVSGFNRAIRVFTSSADAGSKRFFIERDLLS
jgi:hypothetical protein